MTNHVERLRAALTVLAGHGHIKQRLIKAFEENLADIRADELPIALKQPFADLRHEMHLVTPLNGEGPICASVRKMSIDEASECAASMVSLYGDLIRMNDDAIGPLKLTEVDEQRVPPFLIKSN